MWQQDMVESQQPVDNNNAVRNSSHQTVMLPNKNFILRHNCRFPFEIILWLPSHTMPTEIPKILQLERLGLHLNFEISV